MTAHIFNIDFSPFQPFVLILATGPYIFTLIEHLLINKDQADESWLHLTIQIYVALLAICQLTRFFDVCSFGQQ